MSFWRKAREAATSLPTRRTGGVPTNDRSDSELLALISRGDLRALGVVYDRHAEPSWRMALHVSPSGAAAAEIVSDAFLHLWRDPAPHDRTRLSTRLLASVVRGARGSREALRGQRMSTSSGRDERPLMATVNETIDRLHRSLDLSDSEFFCECGHIGCKARLTLSRAEYAYLVEESRPVIALAHADRENAAAAELHKLRGHVHQLEGALASRVKIEQAKGVLVERHGLSPDSAFEALRRRARDERLSLEEVCVQIIAGAAGLDSDDGEPARAQGRAPLRRESHGR